MTASRITFIRLLAIFACTLSCAATWAQSPPAAPNDGHGKWVRRAAHQQGEELTEAALFEALPAPGEEQEEVLFVEEFPGIVSTEPPNDYVGVLPIPHQVAERAMEALSAEFIRPDHNEPTLGKERVPFALFTIDSARPQDIFSLKVQSVYNLDRPDRAEYFWGKIGGSGPKSAETDVDYQEVRIYSEKSLGRASGFFEIPLRFLNPEVNDTTAGLGSLQFGAKSILFEGQDFFGLPTRKNATDRFQVSTVMRTYLSISPVLGKRGLSNGHLSLEPGLLANYQYSPGMYFHGEAKYWIPIGGTSQFAANVVKFGLGVSHVLDSSFLSACPQDSFAIIPTFEVIGWKFGNGQETLSDGTTQSANQSTIINLQGGVRVAVSDRMELGITSSYPITGNHFYENMARFEMRWFW